MNYTLLRNLTAREMVSALERDGFAFDRGTGSHQLYRHSDGRRVTVAFHGGNRSFPRKTLKSVIDQTKWTEEDLRRLKLILYAPVPTFPSGVLGLPSAWSSAPAMYKASE